MRGARRAAPYRGRVQIVEVLAPVLGARCLVLVADDGSCVVVDAGAGVADRVDALVRERGWRPQAVLATHGHLDHTWDAGALAERWAVPVMLHVADVYRLDDPFGTLGVLGRDLARGVSDAASPLGQALSAAGVDPAGYVRPRRVEPFGTPSTGPASAHRSPDTVLELGGVRLVARHAPGHTQGSTLYLVETAVGDVGRDRGDDHAGATTVIATGDVLFAGSIGRTDLPGGDPVAMERTLREVVAALPAAAVVLPGHGPATDVSAELAHNPYLRSV